MSSEELPFEDLVASCAERYDREGEVALQQMCDAHPAHAEALRRAITTMREFGLVGAMAEQVRPPPDCLGGFLLGREIGRGGMGVVYEARQPTLDRTVALKVLPTAWVHDPRQVTRFQNEARAAATLDHPHIVRVHVVGTEAGTHFYAMQLIDGVSVRSLLRELRGTTPTDPGARSVLAGLLPSASPSPSGSSTASGAAWTRRVADLVRQAASALEKAHEVGILHRDVKPGNLLVDRSGHLWITDFGLAHFVREATDLTRSGEFVGTLAYSSPEQIGGRVTVDARSDVYSLGASLYEMLTLRPPFVAGDHAALVRQIVDAEPIPVRTLDSSIPRDLETIQQKAMAKEPTHRYQTAAALAKDLDAFLAGHPIEARPLTSVQRGLRWCQRNPLLAGALLAILVLAIVAGGVGWSAVRAVTAERALSRLSSQHKFDWRREAAAALRRSLLAGQRSESLRLLREAAAEIDQAAPTPEERRVLGMQVRSDVLASLGLWDAAPEAMPSIADDGAALQGLDGTCSYGTVIQGRHLLVRDASGRELARLDVADVKQADTFSPDAEWLAITTKDGCRIWHWRSGRLLVSPWSSEVSKACFDRDSRRYVACLDHNRFVSCDLARGSWQDLLGPIAQRGALASSQAEYLALSPDGHRLATCHNASARLSIYDLGADGPPREILLPDDALACTWSPDGRQILVAGRFQDLLTVDVEAGKVVAASPGHHAEVYALTWSHDGSLLASTGWDGQLFIWDRAGRPLISILVPSHPRQLVFSDDDRGIGWSPADRDMRRPIRWRLQQPAVLREVATGDRPHSVFPWTAFHPSQPLMAVSTRSSVLLLDSGSGDLLGELLVPEVRRLQFLPDGSLFVTEAGDLGCRLYPVVVHDNDLRVGLGRPLAQSLPVREADAQGDVLCVWDGKELHSGKILARQLEGFAAQLAKGAHLRIAPGGRYAALGTFGGSTIAVWDLAQRKLAFEVPIRERSATIAFAPDGRRMVISRRDEHHVYETDTWRLLQVLPRHRLDTVAGYTAFSSDGSLLALPMTRSRLRVCDAATFAPLFELDVPDGGALNEPSFSPDGTTLVLVSAHRKVFVWDLREARTELRALGLDWSEAAIPPPPPRKPLRVVIER